MLSTSELLTLYEARCPEIDLSKTVRHICLYSDGRVTRARGSSPCSSLLCCIDIPAFYYNKSKARLLFCYDNGCVNIMNPKEQLSDKLHRPGMKSNGYNQAAGLQRVFVCEKTDRLVICCRSTDGQEFMRTFRLENRRVHHTMSAAGNQFVKDERPYRWQILPGQIAGKLLPDNAQLTLQQGTERYARTAEVLAALAAGTTTHILCPEIRR